MAKAKNAAPDPVAKPTRLTLTAIEPIRIDGIDVAPGETFEALPEAAAALQAAGAATVTAPE